VVDDFEASGSSVSVLRVGVGDHGDVVVVVWFEVLVAGRSLGTARVDLVVVVASSGRRAAVQHVVSRRRRQIGATIRRESLSPSGF